MKVYCLMENTRSSDEFLCEHGLSLYIDTGKRKILFDMGQGDGFIENAKRLNIDLAKVDFAILSHGHYDHGGGLKKFMEINIHAPVYISKHAYEPHYNKEFKYIGLDLSTKDNSRIILTDGTINIDTDITVFNCNDKEAIYNFDTFGQSAFIDNQFIKEDYRHEQYLLIKEKGKDILFSGCSHKGILNIVNWVNSDIVFGGFHFSKMKLDDTLKGYAQCLSGTKSDFYTCHCTGVLQFEFMKQFADNIKYLSSGDIIEI